LSLQNLLITYTPKMVQFKQRKVQLLLPYKRVENTIADTQKMPTESKINYALIGTLVALAGSLTVLVFFLL